MCIRIAAFVPHVHDMMTRKERTSAWLSSLELIRGYPRFFDVVQADMHTDLQDLLNLKTVVAPDA